MPKKEWKSFYTEKMLKELRGAAPLDISDAHYFADKWGTTHQSIIAKCTREQIPYLPTVLDKHPLTERPTKLDYVTAIEQIARTPLQGLERTPVATLKLLAESLARYKSK